MTKPRNVRVYVHDILHASEQIEKYVKGMSREDFVADEKTRDYSWIAMIFRSLCLKLNGT